MFSMPLIQENFASNSSGESLMLGEQLPIIPVVGAQGEIVYYVPGSAPGVAPIAPNGVAEAVRLDPLQNETLFGNAQILPPFQPDGLMVQQISNGFLPINGANLNPLPPPNVAPTPTHQVQHANGVPHSTTVPQFSKSLFLAHSQTSADLKDRLFQSETPSNPFQTNASSSIQNASLGSNGSHESCLKTNNMSIPSLMKFSCYSKIDQNSFEQQHTLTKLEESIQEFGPVEKAIFKQALSVHHKQQTIESISKSSIQEVPDHLRGKKYCREMFEAQPSKGGNTCNRLIGYNLITKGNTNAPKTSQNFINSIESSSTTTTTPQRVASKAPKPPVLPNIRYHPYPNIKSGETKENSKASENTAVCTFFQQPCNSASNVTSPANHVHSVSVPRGGSYTTPKSSNESQSIRKSPGDDVSNDSSKVKESFNEKSDELLTDVNSSTNKPNSSSEIPASASHNSQEEDNLTTEDPTDNAEICSSKSGDSPPPPPPQREVNLPNPLPSYITKIDKPPSRVLKESLHCTTCDVYVNSDNQMKQHINSLRHKNTLQGLPAPAKPARDEKPKLRADQYRCNVCKVTLNSDIQLSQHLASQRHKNMLEGKPPKPRWSPYDRQQAVLPSAPGLRLPFKTLSASPLLAATQGPNTLVTSSVPLPNALPGLSGLPTLRGNYLTASPALPGATHLKQASVVLSDGGVLQAREFVYVGGPQLGPLSTGTQIAPAALPAALVSGQQHVQLQPVMASQPQAVDWLTANGIRLAT